MNRIEDDRIIFYLRHQQRIEEWAALAKHVTTAANQFLSSCKGDIEALASEHAGAKPHVSLDESYPKLFLCRSDWFPAGGKTPLIGIGVEWNRSGVDFTTAGKCAYAGVWVNVEAAGGTELKKKLGIAFKGAELIQKYKLLTGQWWPTYRYEVAQGEYWTGLEPYRRQLLDSIRFFWTMFAPIIERCIATGH